MENSEGHPPITQGKSNFPSKVKRVLNYGKNVLPVIPVLLLSGDSHLPNTNLPTTPPAIIQKGEVQMPSGTIIEPIQSSWDDTGKKADKDQSPNKNTSLDAELKTSGEQKQRKLDSLRINKEQVETIFPNSTMIDFELRDDVEGVNLVKQPLNEEMFLKQMLGEDYLSPQKLEAEFGPDFKKDIRVLYSQVGKKYPKVAIAYDMIARYSDHGERVKTAENQTLEIFGFFERQTDCYPIQNLLNPGSMRFVQNGDGSVGYFFEVNEKSIIEAIEEIKKINPNIIRFNLSFHVGEQGLKYKEKEVESKTEPDFATNIDPKTGEILYYPLEGDVAGVKNEKGTMQYILTTGEIVNPLTEEEWEKYKNEHTHVIKEVKNEVILEDAYTPEKAKENLPRLFEIPKAYPDFLFFAAGGNNTDDLTILKKDQPDNLITVAEWTSEDRNGPFAAVDGADIYVNNRDFNIEHGSSFSTPTISKAADILETRGYDNKQIRELLFKSCDIVEYERYNQKTNSVSTFAANVFNPEKFKALVEMKINK